MEPRPLVPAHPSLPAVVPRIAAPAWRRGVQMAAALLAAAAASTGAIQLHTWVHARETPNAMPAPPVYTPADDTTVRISITAADWTTWTVETTIDRLRTDPMLWRQMHIGDWDRVPPPLMHEALDAVLRLYRPALRSASWGGMDTSDWDLVPQPIRAAAYLRMAHYWSVQRGIGQEFGLDPRRMGQVVGAIIMAESWFEHRAVNSNQYGRDLGLAQCSDWCRQHIDAMASRGEITFAPQDADYFDPLVGTRVAAVWFERELHRANGDVPLAIRAYHRGLDAALDEKGDVYLAKVQRLRELYVRTQEASDSWRYLTRRIAESDLH